MLVVMVVNLLDCQQCFCFEWLLQLSFRQAILHLVTRCWLILSICLNHSPAPCELYPFVFIKKNLKFDVLYLPKFLSVYLISLLFWHSAFWYYSDEALLCLLEVACFYSLTSLFVDVICARHYWMFVGPCCTRFVSYWMLLTLLPCFMTLLYSVMPPMSGLFSRPKMGGGMHWHVQ